MAGTVTKLWKTAMACMCGKQTLRPEDAAPNKFKALNGSDRYILNVKHGAGPCGPCDLCIIPTTSDLYTGNAFDNTKLVFGNGSTEPNENAYNVSNPISSGLSISGYDSTNGVVRFNVKNTSNTDITIGEFGVCGVMSCFGSLSSTVNSIYTAQVLLYHHVFDEPVTLHSGTSDSIGITMRTTMSGNVSASVQA